MAIKDNTRAVLAKANELKRRKLELSALLVERKAKEICPVDTGTARRSITHEVGENRAVIGSNIEYFPYIELGTKKMAAFAPLRRALEASMKEIKRIFGVR